MPGKRPKGKSGPKVKKSVTKTHHPRGRNKTVEGTKRLNALKDSQKQLSIVLDTALMGIWEWTLKTDKVTWAGSVFEIFGLSTSSFAANFEEYLELVHPHDRQRITESLQQTMELGYPYNIEYRIRHTDGSIRWLNARATVHRDKRGKAIRMSGTVQDITERKLIEEEREEWKRRFDLVTSSAGLLIYDYDLSSGNVRWSGNPFEVLGYHPEELGDVNRWLDLIHPDDRVKSFTLLEEAKRTAKPYECFYRFRMKNGTYCYIHDQGIFLSDENTIPNRMLGMMSDVTQMVSAQEALKESELRFRTLQQASFGGIGLHDRGRIIDCNQGLCDITGYNYDELVDSDGLNLIAPEWRRYVYEKIISDYDKTYDVEGIKKDGTRYFLEIRGKNIPYKNEEIRVTEFRDITERKRTEQTIQEQNTRLLAVAEELRRKNNQLEEFTQIVSHNLRSPVGNMIVLLNFMDSASSDTERREYLMLLKEAASTTQTMLNELNEVLKVKQNRNIEKQHLHFEQVLKQVRSMLNAKITELGAEITTDFAAAPSLQYPSIYLESIILNLLDNALKYHVPGRPPRIHFKTTINKAGETILEVRDNGLGINLERFGHHVFKLRKTFHLHPESRGIGLFMIKNQIEAMGGEITISSRENEGTSFFINFNKHQTDGL